MNNEVREGWQDVPYPILNFTIEKQFNPIKHFLKLLLRNAVGRKNVNNIPQRPDQDPMMNEVAIDLIPFFMVVIGFTCLQLKGQDGPEKTHVGNVGMAFYLLPKTSVLLGNGFAIGVAGRRQQ